MTLKTLLFSPSGRAAPRTFWRGVVVLTAVMVLVIVANAYGGVALAGIAGLVSLVMPYPYFCVYAKRLHDSGRGAGWFALFFVGYLLLEVVLQEILMPLLSPEGAALRAELQALAEAGQYGEIFARGPDIARMTAMTSLVTLFLINFILGSLAARLHSDPDPNRFGAPTGA